MQAGLITREQAGPAPAVSWERVSRHRPCPICGRSDFCEVLSDGKAVHCMRTPSAQPVAWRQGGFIHWLSTHRSTLTGLAAIGAAPGPQVERLDAATADQMNRRLLELLPDLIPGHEPLITPIPPAQVRSFNRAISERTATAIAMQFGSELADRYPAIIQSGYDQAEDRPIYRLAAHHNGVIIPFENERTGHVLGFQLKAEKAFKSSRYTWLSHDSLSGTPFGVIFRPAATRVIITEGRRKAESGSHYYFFSTSHFIYLAGVSSYDRHALLAELNELNPAQVTISFDQDKHHNKAVHDAELKLIKLLQRELPDVELTTLEWPEQAGKGLDDVIAAGFSDFQFQTVSKPKRKQFDNTISAEAHAAAFGQPRPIYQLSEVHTKHAAAAHSFFNDEPAEPQQLVITSATGTGKSTAFDEKFAGYAARPETNRRSIILGPNRANIAERISNSPALQEAVKSGVVAVQFGRRLIDLADPKQERSAYDCANSAAQEAGAARHVPAKTACSTCKYGSQENWLASADSKESPDRPFKCEAEGYLASRKASKKAKAVLATRESYLNDSDELQEFDRIVIDEDPTGQLIEKFEIGVPEITTWRDKIKSEDLAMPPAWLLLMDIVTFALTSTLPSIYGEGPTGSYLHPALESLQQAAQRLGQLNLEFMLSGMLGPEHDGTYYFESPYTLKGTATRKIPFRAGQDLLAALRGEGSITARRNQDGSYSLVIHRQRRKLIELLKGKSIAILDATLSPLLRELLPGIKEISFEVPQNLRVTQITNSLYSSRNLERDTTRADTERAIAKFCEGKGRVLVITPLKFRTGPKAIKLPANAVHGHWGLDDRATNVYSGFDGLVLLGHHMRPVDLTKAEVDAIRGYTTRTASSAAPDQEPDQAPEKLRLYNYLDPATGKGAGRWSKYDPDPAYQSALEHDYAAFVTQAIGRLRPALRPASAAPAEVLLLSAEVAGALKIDNLVTTKAVWQDEGMAYIIIMPNAHVPVLHEPAAPADHEPEEPTNISSQFIALVHPGLYEAFTPLPNRPEAPPLPAVSAANPPPETAAPAYPWATQTAGVYAGMIEKATSHQHLEGILRRVSLNISHRPDYRRLQELSEAMQF